MTTLLTPIWTTVPGVLGTATELTTSTFSVSVSDTVNTTTFSVISGSLPTGFTLTNSVSTGTANITGKLPLVIQNTASTFVLRAKNSAGITDRTFRIDSVSTSTSTVTWVTPSGFINLGPHGQSHLINRSTVDYQFTATSRLNIAPMVYHATAGNSTATVYHGLPPGLTLSKSGKLSGTVDELFTRPMDAHEYAFNVSAYDGLSTSTSTFNIRVVTTDILGADSASSTSTAYSVITADKTVYNADGSSFVLPEWVDSYNLGVVRSNNHQVIHISNYDPYPKEGPIIYDWTMASVIPITKCLADSPSSNVGLQLRNREGDSVIYLKGITVFPKVGQVFRLDPYVLDANTNEYEIISVTETGVDTCTITFGIRVTNDTVVPVRLHTRILDNTNLHFGERSQHPPNFNLDPDSGVIFGTFDFQPQYLKSYSFTVRILKISTNDEIIRYMGPWTPDKYYKANDIVRIKTEVDQPGKPNNGRIQSALDLPTSGNVLGDKYVSTYNDHLWLYTGTGPINGFVDQGRITVGSLLTDQYTYYISTYTDLKENPSTLVPIPPPSAFNPAHWVPYDISNPNVSITDKVFTLAVQGDIQNEVSFVTESNLGTMYAGHQSELSVKAVHATEQLEITYDVISGGLPPGLTLRHDGTITGKIPYNFKTSFDFTLDSGLTTFDTQFRFTIGANDAFARTIASKQFVISISQPDPTKYTHIYATPMLDVQYRDSYAEFINNTTVFNPSALYRPHDPAFGLQHNIKAYFEHGVEQIKLDDYSEPLRKYFYKKKFYFGKIQTKPAYDTAGNYVYDAVYVEVIDPFVNNDGISIGPYLNSANVTVFPNSVYNIQSSIEGITINGVNIKTDEYLRPRFMRTVQAGTGAPLGFVLAIPLCYAVPGAGESIVKQAEIYNFDFSKLSFEIDRLVVEDSLPKETAKYMLFPRREVIGSDSGINITDYRLYGDDLLELDTEGNEPLYMEI